MKVLVTNPSGETKVLDLQGVWTVHNGDKGLMSSLKHSSGFEHWFNEDGTYDGWGMDLGEGVPETEMSKEQLKAIMESEAAQEGDQTEIMRMFKRGGTA